MINLIEIESWRDKLATHIYSRNPTLTEAELNFAVQRTIERIVFLRTCEQRGLESYGRLRSILNGPGVYPRLVELYHAAERRYNCGLFNFGGVNRSHEKPDYLTPSLRIGDEVLKGIIEFLCRSKNSYQFSRIPADILGQVYEQFLGKVIRIIDGQTVVEDKPGAKKAGGVFYTPAYIVEYIVKNTVGKLLEEKTPEDADKLKILDPACGSGSFLIGAYQYLLDWRLAWYSDNDPHSWAKSKTSPIYMVSSGESGGATWRLTESERRRILTNNIFGVDIDSQAIEVTKLSLLLKMLEGRNERHAEQDPVLPDLGDNIKCGNALIGTAFYEDYGTDIADKDRRRINAFDWNHEFPDIFKAGGFDAVIGNPPYVFGEYHDQKTGAYFRDTFRLARRQYDTYQLFIERGVDLTADGGRLSLIVPDALLVRDEARDARELLLKNGLDSVFHCGRVFAANVSALVFTAKIGERAKYIQSLVGDDSNPIVEHSCSRSRFERDRRRALTVHMSDKEAALISSLQDNYRRLGELVSVSRGEEIGKHALGETGSIPIIAGQDITRYAIAPPTRFISSIKKNSELYRAPKILVVKTGDKCVAALDLKGMATLQSVYNLRITESSIPPKALLGILNSRLTQFFVRKTFTDYKLIFPQLNQSTVESIPIPVTLEGSSVNRLVSLVDGIMSLHEHLTATLPHNRAAIQRQIDAVDDEIDRLIYQIYDLTEEEMSLIGPIGRQRPATCAPSGRNVTR